MTHRLYVVVSIHHEALGTIAALTINNRIPCAHSEGSRSDPHSLHHLFDGLRRGTHAATACRDRRHSTKCLQALGETTRMTVLITIEADEAHNRFLRLGKLP